MADQGKEEDQQKAKPAVITGPENLKVYIRVRPRLKNEYLKETAAFVDPTV
jgi:hypothetical protein